MEEKSKNHDWAPVSGGVGIGVFIYLILKNYAFDSPPPWTFRLFIYAIGIVIYSLLWNYFKNKNNKTIENN